MHICSLLICILANRKNFSISVERGLCYPFVLFSRHFGATGLFHLVVCTATSGIWIYHHFKGKVASRFERKILALPKVGDLTYNITALCFCVVWVLEIYKIILDWCFLQSWEVFKRPSSFRLEKWNFSL